MRHQSYTTVGAIREWSAMYDIHHAAVLKHNSRIFLCLSAHHHQINSDLVASLPAELRKGDRQAKVVGYGVVVDFARRQRLWMSQIDPSTHT